LSVATASPSVPRLDISIPAEALNSAGVLLIANYRTATDPSTLAVIPSEVLVSLSALPIGGVRAANRTDVPVLVERVVVRSADTQIRFTISNQPATDSEQGIPAADALRQSGANLTTLLKAFSYSLPGAWRTTLDDLFTNGHWEGRLSEW